MKLLVCSIIVIVLAALQAGAQNPNLGTSGAQFLEIPAGARATAIGGAVVANSRDASALFWNPAGIVNVPSADLHLSHTTWWASMAITHAAFAFSHESFGSFGVSVAMLTVEKMEVTTELEPEGTGQFFDARDLMIGVTYARRLTEDFSVGVTAKYVNQRIWSQTASGVAFDVGTQYHVGFRDLTIAMSMSNFGGDMRYDGQELAVKYDADPSMSYNRLTPARLTGEDYALPLRFQVGFSITPITLDDMSLLLEVDAVHPNDNDERLNVGGELNILRYFNLRGGYRFGYDTERATFGAGVDVPLGDLRVVVDYAYATYDLLPSINRFSLGIRF